MNQGSLFTRDFLEEGITETDAWRGLDEARVEMFRSNVRAAFKAFPIDGTPTEAQTEQDLIYPILRALGWDQYLTQVNASTKGREDVPDVLLFADAAAKAAANRERRGAARYRHGVAIAENKAWNVALDRGDPSELHPSAPSTQMLRYMSRVETLSDRAVQWGILTNGRHWRLYFQGARSRSEEFLELDLPVIADVPSVEPGLFAPPPERRSHFLKVFLLLVGRDAFTPSAGEAESFLRLALVRTREWEAGVSGELSDIVFDQVFPNLIRALAQHDPSAPKSPDAAYLDEVRRAALTLLYRLLFVLYAEDRDLLPSHEAGYDDYSLRRLRHDVRERIGRGDTLSVRSTSFYSRLRDVFSLIDSGDAAIGLPPYNGGLFEVRQHPLLDRARPSDAEIGPLIDLLSRRQQAGARKWINYRDLSVQHLGSIYERLLEYDVVADDGGIAVRLNPFARKGSGSYYTHEDLVGLIIQRTVGPLIDERMSNFAKRVEQLKAKRTPKTERLKDLAAIDPASAILDLKVCDPAMGSGHFLVSLVDYLADQILEAMQQASELVEWADKGKPYISPLAARIAGIRGRILAIAEREGWRIERANLDDRHIVRRMILKRSIYGVDKNPMAVELAKVALWLHTFTVGAPLSFLDHHLRCGDSLFGEWVRPLLDELAERYHLMINPYIQRARRTTAAMESIEAATDADIAEVHGSAQAFRAVEDGVRPLKTVMDFRHALRWIGVPALKGVPAIEALFDGSRGELVTALTGDPGPGDDAADAARIEAMRVAPRPRKKGASVKIEAAEIEAQIAALKRARGGLGARENFLHWEIAFPGVWADWESAAPTGGFDAVIGNPPWDRIKLQEVEWFASRKPEIAHAVRAADRKNLIAKLEKDGDALWGDYLAARERAERMAEVARSIGDYPLLSGGDTNIYALFVERAQRLIRPNGMVGLLTPSGIASDLSASAFFRSVATTGRIAALLDFENRWPTYFPDVDSRFKFSVFVTAGAKRSAPKTNCAFFLNGVTTLKEREFTLTADDFIRVNPNTGTAPVFRSRRDAEITRGVYERLPVLVRHSPEGEQAVWPVRYVRMFDMTNDSHLFKTRTELEKAGSYAVAGSSRMRKGTKEYAPLYEGKMVQMYDHRAANIVVNSKNLNRPAQPESATSQQHGDPRWLPTPQFYVAMENIDWPGGASSLNAVQWIIGFKDVTAPTNIRTMIASAVPLCGLGNTLPIVAPALADPAPEQATPKNIANRDAAVQQALRDYKSWATLLMANLNSLPLDFIVRQKVQGQLLNWFIVEQLPVVPPEAFERKIGKTKIADYVRGEVLRLTYTAHDMTPFARDMGYDGPPFAWDEDDRRHRRARLDALFFHLYGIDAKDAAYILDTFPIVREQDEAAFGRYLTKELVLAYMRAVKAGDLTSQVSV